MITITYATLYTSPSDDARSCKTTLAKREGTPILGTCEDSITQMLILVYIYVCYLSSFNCIDRGRIFFFIYGMATVCKIKDNQVCWPNSRCVILCHC